MKSGCNGSFDGLPEIKVAVKICLIDRSQMAVRLGNRALNQKVAGFDSQPRQMTLCPWARHFTLLALGEMSLYLL